MLFRSLFVFIYFVFIKIRHRLDTADLIAIWLVAVPFLGPYTAVEVGGGIPAINFNRLFVVLLFFSAFSSREGPPVRLTNGLDYALLFFVGASLCSVVASFMIRTPLRLFLDAILTPTIFYFVAKKCVRHSDFLPKLLVACCIALFLLGGLGAYEGLSGRDVLHWEGEETHSADTEDFRVNGPMGTAENYGTVMVMLLLFLLILRGWQYAELVRRRYLRAAVLVGVIAVAYTLTRGIWLSLIAGWLTFCVRRRPFFSLTMAGFAVVVWLVLQQAILPQIFGDFWQNRMSQKKTLYARIATYKSALAMFEDHPILGVGFGTYSEMWERFPGKYFFQHNDEDSVGTPHNLFLAILAEMGLLGAIAFLALQIQVFAKALYLAHIARHELETLYAEAIIATAVAFLVVGLGLNFTYDTGFVSKLYFLFLGVLSGMVDQAPLKQDSTTLEMP